MEEEIQNWQKVPADRLRRTALLLLEKHAASLRRHEREPMTAVEMLD
jgi:hypothetical protein